MAIQKELDMVNHLGSTVTVNYHTVVNLNVDVIHNKTTVLLGSYRDKAQYDWDKTSFVCPPNMYTFTGIITPDLAQSMIVALDEFDNSVIVV